MAKGVTNEKLTELARTLDVGRSTVFVSATALDHGETDLELQSATALKSACESLGEVYDEMMSSRQR